MKALLLALCAATATAAPKEWSTALKSRVKNDDTFLYDSAIWTDGTPLNEFDTSDTVNVLTSAYSSVFVESIMIEMNNEEYTINLPDADKGKWTLQELVTMDAGYAVSDGGGWAGSTGNYFNYDSDERTSDKYYCHDFGFNYMAIENLPQRRFGANPKVRLGVFMDGSYACYDPNTAEGIGMTGNYGANQLNSGRMQGSSPQTFTAATVSVYGQTEDRQAEIIFFSAWWNHPDNYQRTILGYNVFDKEEIVVPYTLTFNVQIKRTNSWWGNIFQIQDESWYRSPGTWLYPDYNSDGYYNQYPNWEHSYFKYTGRRLHLSFKSTAATYDSANSDVSVPLGKWTHIAVVAYMDHMIVYFNGHAQYLYQINGFLSPLETGIPWMSNTAWHAQLMMHGMRWYPGMALRKEYLTEQAAEWPPLLCSDGERQVSEECDDGNALDGDGCSSACEVEPGFVCDGATAKYVNTDRCEAGEHAAAFDFEDGLLPTADWDHLGDDGGTWEVTDAAAAAHGSYSLRINNRKADTGETYTYAQFDVDGLVERAFIEFALKFVKVPARYFNLAVTFFEQGAAGMTPDACHSYPYCDDVVFYRKCYNRRDWRYCDEVEPDMPTGTWTTDALYVADKLVTKYGFLPSELPTAITVQISMYTSSSNDDSEGEVWMDEINVALPDNSHDYKGLTVESYAYTDGYASLVVDGVDLSTNGDGFNVLLVDGATHEPLAGATAFDTAQGFADYVLSVAPGVVVMAATKTALTCDADCADALYYIGGHGYAGATGSMAIIGYTKGNHNSVPFRIAAESDPPVSVHSMVRFHHVNDTVPEHTHQLSPIGFPVRVDEEAGRETTYGISNYQNGYLGCYRVGSSRELSHKCYHNWGYNSPASCNKCCATQGYNYFALWYYYGCYCGDTYGDRDCDFSGDCGIPRVHDKWCTDRRTYGDLAQTSGSYYYEAVFMTTGRTTLLDTDAVVASLSCDEARSTDRCNYAIDGSTSTYYRSNDYTALSPTNTAALEFTLDAVQTIQQLRLKWRYTESGRATGVTCSYKLDAGDAEWTQWYDNQDSYNGRAFDIIWGPAPAVAAIRVEFNAPGTGSYYELKEIDFQAPSEEYWGRNLPLDQDYLPDDYFWEYYRAITHATGAHFKGNEAWTADPVTGQAELRLAIMNFEVTTGYMVGVVAYEDGYDSDWFSMSANGGVDSFVELDHGLPSRPDWIHVQVQSPSTGFTYQGIGMVQHDGRFGETYGGLLFAYNEDKVRLWAPTHSEWATGSIINVQNGWGGEEQAEALQTADVRVTAFVAPAPDFDTGWFAMESQNAANSIKVVRHDVGDLLHSRVKVMVRAVDGDNDGYVFEAAGAAQTDDDAGTYGGVIFGYDDEVVRIWAPVRNDLNADNCPDDIIINSDTQLCDVAEDNVGGFGHIINVPDGWAHSGSHQQVSDSADVRFQIWVLEAILHMPYGTAQFDMSANGLAFTEHYHGFAQVPVFVKAAVICEDGANANFHFEGVGSGQGTDWRPKKEYGGIVFGYDANYVRVWAPGQSSNDIKHAYGSLVLTSDGWGNGTYSQESQGGYVRVLAYKEYYGMIEYAYVNVVVADINEYPNPALISIDLPERTESGYLLGTIDALDEDWESDLSLEVLVSEFSDAFAVDVDGNVFIADNELLDFETNPYFDINMRVHDDNLYVDTIVAINVIDGNDPCSLWPPFAFDIEEESPKNSLVGDPINGTDPDFGQSIIFSLDADVTTFRIASCGGQLYVLDSVDLDHEDIVGKSVHNITVWATDDGPDAINTSAIVTITVTDINDEPEWLTDIAYYVTENSPAGTPVGIELGYYAYDVDEGDYLNFSISAVENQILADDSDQDALADDDDPTDAAVQLIYINSITGNMTIGSIELNFEDADSIGVTAVATDGNPAGQLGTPNLATSVDFTIYVLDANDAPVWTDSLERYIDENVDALTRLDSPVQANDEDEFDYVEYAMIDGQGKFDIDSDTGEVFLVSGQSLDYEDAQSYSLEVQVFDHGILTANGTADPIYVSGTLNVSIVDVNEQPSVSDAHFNVSENSPENTWVGTELVASDPDVLAYEGRGQDLFFSIVAGNDDDTFKISTSGQLMVNIDQIDYESGTTSYSLTVQVDDDGAPTLSDTATVTIDVLDENDAPAFDCDYDVDVTGYCALFAVDEGSVQPQFVGTVRAVDPENVTLAYTVIGSAVFEIAADSDFVQVATTDDTVLDAESNVDGFYLIEVETVDQGPVADRKSERTFYRIDLLDVDEPPAVRDCELIVSNEADVGDPVGLSIEIAANPYYPDRDMDPDEFGTLSFHITGEYAPPGLPQNDPTGIFTINSASGQLYVADNTPLVAWNPVADDPLFYYLEISVWDGANAANLTARVNVSDLNNAPQIEPSFALSCYENTPAGTECGPYIYASDKDVQDILTYSFVAIPNDQFAIETVRHNSTDTGHAIITVGVDNALDYEAAASHTFDVLVVDSAPELQLSAVTTVTVTVLDVNDAPEASAESFAVDENTATGTVVGSVAWTDQDGDALTFAITSDTSGLPFDILATGDESFDVRVAADVDYEAQASYDITVSATDPEGLSDSAVVTVAVNDLNEPPVLTAVALEIDENSRDGEAVVTSADVAVFVIEVVDPDLPANQMSVTIDSGDDEGAFEVVLSSDDGHAFYLVVTADDAIDYEDVTSYSLQITVAETETGELLSDTATFPVAVNNLNDVTVEAWSEGVAENPFDVYTADGLLPTEGGTLVTVNGTNFGSKHTQEPVNVTYGALGTEYVATCEVAAGGNTMLSCYTRSGLGRSHIWTVVTNPDTFAHATTSDSTPGFEAFSTSYAPPAISGVELGTSANGFMRTQGGDVITLTGTNFGPRGDDRRQHVGVGALDTDAGYLSTSETANGERQCEAGRAFLELDVGDAVAVTEHGEPVDAQWYEVTSVVHPVTAGLAITPTNLRRAPCVSDSTGSFRAKLQVAALDSSVSDPTAERVWSVVASTPPTVLLDNLPSMTADDASPSSSAALEGVELRAEDCEVTVSHTEIVCLVPEGVGRGFTAQALLGGQASAKLASADAQLSYHEPVVTEILETDVLMDTSGGDPITLLGAFFGPSAAFAGYGNGAVSYGSSYGVYYADCSVWGSTAVDIVVDGGGGGGGATAQRDILNCTTVAGVSYDLPWQVTVGAQTSNASADLTSYKPPSISEMPSSYWPFAETAGGNAVVLKGDEFGLEIQNVDYVRYGMSAQFDADEHYEIPYLLCEISSTAAQEELTCQTVPGTGANHHWEVSVGGQVSGRFVANSSYAAPIVTDFEVPGLDLEDGTVSMQAALEDFDTAGYESVVVLGRNFGPALDDPLYTSPYAPPIEAYAAWNDYRFPAVMCNVTTSHTELTCLTTAGVGTLLKWFVFIDLQESYVASTSYGPPVLSKVRGDKAQEAATVGGDLVRLVGENFGPCYDCTEEAADNFLEEVTYGPTGNEYDVSHLCWVSVAHTEISCYTMEGVGKDLRFYITVGGQRMSDYDSENGPTMSYAAPNVTAIEPSVGSTTGGYIATVTGHNFGPESECKLQFWGKTMDIIGFGDAHDWATFLVPTGQHYLHDVQTTQVSKLEAHNQYSNAVQFNYSAPIIDRLVTQEGSTRDSKLLTLHGAELDSLVTTGGHFGEAESFEWTMDTGEVVEFSNEVSVFAFGTEESTKIRCESTGYLWSHDEITCEVNRVNGTLLVDVGGRRSNLFAFDNPSPVVTDISLVEPGTEVEADALSTEGGALLTIHGRYFEDDVTNVAVKLMSQYFDDALDDPVRFMNNVLCPNLTLVTLDFLTKEGELTCVVPPGQGENVVVKVVRGGSQVSDYTLESDEELCFPCFDYEVPDVEVYEGDTAFPVVSPTTGLGVISLHGSNLGEAYAHVYVEGVELAVASQTHDEITVEIPAGVGTDHDLVVSVGGQTTEAAASADELLTYEAPSVSGLTVGEPDSLLPTVGGTLVTIAGANFGDDDGTTAIAIDLDSGLPTIVSLTEAFGKEEDGFVVMSLYPDTPLPISSWSHDEVVFVAPPGEGTDIAVTLSAGGQTAATVDPLLLDYRAPALYTRDPGSGFTNGLAENNEDQTFITLTGDDFGTQGLEVFFDGASYAPSSFDHSTAVFALPIGQGEDIVVYVAVGGQVSNALDFDYHGPQIHWMDPVHGPTDGCHEWESKGVWVDRTDGMNPLDPEAARLCEDPVLVTVHGRSLGHADMVVMVGPNEAEWDCDDCLQNHTIAVVELPGYFGTGHNLTVQVEERTSNGLRFDYDPPELISSYPGSAGKEFLYGYANAQGDFLTIAGNNLGAVETDVNITLSGVECLDAQWNEGGTDSADGQPYLTCQSQSDVVGAKNVTVDVAGQTAVEYVRLTEVNSLLSTICKEAINADQTKTQYYGRKGEVCLPCPEGAQCSAYEGYDDPWALPGFWREYYAVDTDSAADYCEPERRQSRDECPTFLPCEPEEACAGNNTCSEGYEYMIYECADYQASRGKQTCESHLDCDPKPTKECSYKSPWECTECVWANDTATVGTCECIPSIRCSLCTVREYFKLDGKCEPCPSNPWVLIVGFACGAVCACIGGYVLNRKKFNLAFLSIGVDYFQILALFASADVAWPSLVLDIFRWMSLFNFNIDITAPECAMPDLQYEDKWQFIMMLPIACFLACVAAYVYMWCSFKLHRGKKGSYDADILIATYLVLFYYLYLTLTKKALDIFHCVPVEPDDGYTYAAFTSVNCETGLCRCWEVGGVQMELFPYAVICFIVYSVGFPTTVAAIIFYNKTLIKEDQILRAKGLEHSKSTQKGSLADKAFHVRARFHKMYYHFKPGKVYWILLIINRKFWIALSGLMFADNPAFQFSVILLVLFMSYVMQVKHRPFMSTVEREAVVAAHAAKAETSRKHMRIAAAVQNEEANQAAENRLRKRGFSHALSGGASKESTARYFWDYNTVEAYLLACAILICLAGVMFDASADTDRDDLKAHRVFITYMTIIVIFFSLAYYFLVFASEVGSTFGVNEWWITQKLMSKKSQAGEQLHHVDESEIETATNPMMLAANSALVKNAADQQAKEVEMAELNATNRDLMNELAAAKQREQANAALSGFSRAPKKKKKEKKEYGPQMSSGPADM